MILSALVGYFIAKKMDQAKYEIFVEQAKAKAKAIEHEAQILLEIFTITANDLELSVLWY